VLDEERRGWRLRHRWGRWGSAVDRGQLAHRVSCLLPLSPGRRLGTGCIAGGRLERMVAGRGGVVQRPGSPRSPLDGRD
jgi:hypothetical protein